MVDEAPIEAAMAVLTTPATPVDADLVTLADGLAEASARFVQATEAVAAGVGEDQAIAILLLEVADILDEPDLELLAASPQAGVYLAASLDGRRVFVTGHPEYDAETLGLEYERDLAAGLPIEVPHDYYPDDDPSRTPPLRWRSHGDLLFTNWLNYCVYQETPYDLHELTRR